MSGSTPPTRHRRAGDGADRLKIAAAAIAVATLLLTITGLVESHRLVTAWRDQPRPDESVSVDPAPPLLTTSSRTTTSLSGKPVRVHPGPSQVPTPGQPSGTPIESPNATPTGSPDWVGTVGPACDQPTPTRTTTLPPSPTNDPTPEPAPSPPTTPAPADTSTPDDSATCYPPPTPSTSTPHPASSSAAHPVPIVNQ